MSTSIIWSNSYYTVSHASPLAYGIPWFYGIEMPECKAKQSAFLKALAICCQDLEPLQCTLRSLKGESVSNPGPGIDSSQ